MIISDTIHRIVQKLEVFMKQQQTKYSLLLIFATIIWGGAFVAQSVGSTMLGPFAFNCIRFFLGALSLIPAFVYMDVKDGIMTHLYDRYLINRDREVRVLDPLGEYGGIAEGINDRGELIIKLKDGSYCTVASGEVSVRGVYGYV